MNLAGYTNYDFRVNTVRSDRGSATMSSCGRFRLRLTRRVGGSGKACTFILLNPLMGDHLTNDAPTSRCIELAQAWGCGELHLVSLFAWRTKTLEEFRHFAREPNQYDLECARENKHYLAHSALAASTTHGHVVCAWGREGRLQDMDALTMRRLRDRYITPRALKVDDGDPCHPLDAEGLALPLPYTGRAA